MRRTHVCFYVLVNICRVCINFAFSSKRFKSCRSKASCFVSNQTSLREVTYSTRSCFYTWSSRQSINAILAKKSLKTSEFWLYVSNGILHAILSRVTFKVAIANLIITKIKLFKSFCLVAVDFLLVSEGSFYYIEG